jgi:amino acid transporter
MRRKDMRAILNRMNAPAAPLDRSPKLRRTLTLPWLVFYGVGVTVGAGIFALIGEILRLAGDAAPLAFLIAGVIAAVTGASYALLAAEFPRAGGDAVFVNRGLGRFWGRVAGLGVAVVGVVSSAAIALAFAGYAATLLPVPRPLLLAAVMALLSFLAFWGVRESVAFASLITVLEVGVLAVVIAVGLPLLGNLPPAAALAGLAADSPGAAAILGAALIAFFAFIGFEDIENMAEETIHPSRTVPRAIFLTLAVTIVLYATLALIAAAAPNRDAIAASPAPVALLFGAVTGLDPAPVAAIAAIAMVNGILVQILMASRTLYGMASEGLAPKWFGVVSPRRQTPARATLFIAVLILALALTFPLTGLAEATSLVVLAVFLLVNLSLYAIGRQGLHPRLARWRHLGIVGAGLCLGILVAQTAAMLAG